MPLLYTTYCEPAEGSYVIKPGDIDVPKGEGMRRLIRQGYRNKFTQIARDHFSSATVIIPQEGINGHSGKELLRAAVVAAVDCLMDVDMDIVIQVWERSAFEGVCQIDVEVDLSAPGLLPEDDAPLRDPEDDDYAGEPFSDMLIRMIDYSGLTGTELYRRANVGRQVYNDIKRDYGFRPSKRTVVAFILALELSTRDAGELMEAAGYAYSERSAFDLIIDYCIKNGLFDVFDINEILFAAGLPQIGE